MASEAFVKGAEYYGPGAGLVLSGAGYRNITTYWSYIQYGQGTPEGLAIPTGQKSPANRPDSTEGEEYTITYGLQDYDGPQSTFGSYLSTVAANASTWQNISAEACGQEYQACHGRRQYRDVIMILDVGQGEPEGYDGCKYLLNLTKVFLRQWFRGELLLDPCPHVKDQASDVRRNRGFE